MKEFKAESKRLLDLMINSIYTNKEIFLRELISNCSDAIDKRHFASLTDSTLTEDFKIELKADKDTKTLTIIDNGCGMSATELEENLGTIAKSGTLAFKQQNKTDESLIGQFGVGFYASFMVANEVTVLSKEMTSDKTYKWFSGGADGYTLEEAQDDDIKNGGTKIVLKLKDKDDDCDYAEFSQEHTIRMLVKKYSDYIRYPIKMGEDTLNSQTPLWKKKKKDVTSEQYTQFYQENFFDFTEPSKVIAANVEGNLNYSLLLFIPKKAPYDYYSKEYEKGLKLYSSSVMIMEKCADIIPDHFGFIKGLVDSGDLSLNISREMLQKDRQLKALAQSVEKKIQSELKKMMESERELYEEMFKEFGNTLKLGAYNHYGAKKDELKDFLLFKSGKQDKMISFKEYMAGLKEGQEFIYYASGENEQQLKAMPKTESVLSEGYDVLYLTDNVDEFVLKVIENYDGKKFKSVNDQDALKVSDEKKEQVKKEEETAKEMLENMTKALQNKVKSVKLSPSLKNNAVSISSDSEISLEMEKVLKTMPGSGVKVERVLELNPEHEIYKKLTQLQNNDQEKLGKYALLLYDAALLQSGLDIEDNVDLSKRILELL